MSAKMGAIHHAHWMAASVYILKMIVVGPRWSEAPGLPSAKQQRGVIELGFFIIYMYVYAFYWFSAPVPADAPLLTLSFWGDMKSWEFRDAALSEVCLTKIGLHTWFLSERHVILTLWSKKVLDETKEGMARALIRVDRSTICIGKPVLSKIHLDSELVDFIGPESWLLLKVSHDYKKEP